MNIKFQIVSIIVFALHVSLDAPYDRCDDLCRVFGHGLGGRCESVESEGRCICQPGNIDLTDHLPTVCD